MTRASDLARLISGGAVFNEASNDVDFRVESNGDANMLFVDAGNDKIGIGTSSPSADLSVDGRITLGDQAGSGTAGAGSMIVGANSFFIQASEHKDSSTRVPIVFSNIGGSAESMRIDASGNVGIGTSSPTGIHSQAKVLELSGGDGGDLIIGNNSSTSIGSGAHIGAIAFKNIDNSTGSAPHYAGIRCESADTSGNMDLRFYTGIANLESDSPQVIIDTSGNVGIGETDISGFGGTYKGLDIAYKGSGLAGRTDNPTLDVRSNIFYDGSNYKYGEGSTTAGQLSVGGAQLIFANAPSGTAGATATLTERMRINSSGQMGINTSSPESLLHVEDSASTTGFARISTTSVGSLFFGGDSTSPFIHSNNGKLRLGTSSNNVFSERMRLESSDHALFYTTSTSAPDGNGGVIIADDGNGSFIQISKKTTSAVPAMEFYNSNGRVGQIIPQSSSTSFTTSSDYRLKENVTTSWDATTRLKQLKPSRFNFKADKDTTLDGFLAHEVSSIVPEAITGTKDEVDTDGNPKYQGIDQSKLVPLMVKTIQELEARIATLESK